MATLLSDPRSRRAACKDPNLKVADVMRTDFRSCNAGTPAVEVATALRLSGSPILPVTQAQVPVGVVTERSLTTAMIEHEGDLSGLAARDLMEPDPPTIPMETPFPDASARLDEAGGFLLAVNRDGLLKGTLTLAEIGPQLSEAGMSALIARLAEAGWPRSGGLLPRGDGNGAPATAADARTADPTAEIKSSKSQAQPHPWDAPTQEHPAPVPLMSPSDKANPMLTARDVMKTDLRTGSPESTVLEAAAIFRDADCGVLPVVEAGRPVGIVTDRDAILALPQYGPDLGRTPVSAIMSQDLATVTPETALQDVLDRFADADVRRLLVVDADGQLAGLLSWPDLVPHLTNRGLGRMVAKILVRER
jgi:CBS domain-containing protein